MIEPFTPKRDVTPYPLTVLDIETSQTGECIGVGMAWLQRETVHYISAPNWDAWYIHYRRIYLDADKETRSRLKTIYAHNGAKFDWLHFAIWAKNKEILSDLACVQSGSMVHGVNLALRLDGERFILRLRDSLRLLPTGLKSLAKTFNVPMQKLEVDPTKMVELLRDNPKMFWEYLEHDVFALQQVLTKFWEMIYSIAGNIGTLPMTLPSLAMRLFRMNLGYSIACTNADRLKVHERLSYFGGRTECFYPGEYDAINIYDINSQYPYAMLTGEFPISYVGEWVRGYDGKHGIYHASFSQPAHTLPCMPILANNSLSFQHEGTGYFTQPEIEQLLSIGGDVQIHDGYVYHHTANPFKEFVSTWYDIKKQAELTGDEGLRYTSKILMNSLYGKFGQQEYGYNIEIPKEGGIQQLIDSGTEFREVGDCVVIGRYRPSATTFVAIASYVTSYARTILYRHMKVATELGNRVVYCDTDSLHLLGDTPLPTSPELGDLKLEYTGSAVYIGKKLYTLPDINKVKAKGIGREARETLSVEDFRDMLNGATRKVSFPVFPSPLEVLSGNRLPAVQIQRTRTIRRTAALSEIR